MTEKPTPKNCKLCHFLRTKNVLGLVGLVTWCKMDIILPHYLPNLDAESFSWSEAETCLLYYEDE